MSNLYNPLMLGLSPQVYYRLNEGSGTSATDASGNSNTGTYTASGVTYNVAGAIVGDSNNGVTLNGSSGDVACPAAIDLSTYSAFTIQCWVKLSTLSLPTSPSLFANDVAGTSHVGLVLFFNTTATSITLKVGNGSTATTCTGNFTFATGTWYLITATWDGSTLTVYVNGVSKGTASFAGPIASTSNHLTFGHNPAGTDFFTGSIDEPAVLNSALPVQTILDLYNVGQQVDGGSGLYRVSNGGTILAADVDQLIEVLQQSAGGTEKGKYWLQGNVYTTGAFLGQFIFSLSRNSTPVSVAIDTADGAAANLNAPTTATLTSAGFEVQDNSTSGVTNAHVGGNWTIQY